MSELILTKQASPSNPAAGKLAFYLNSSGVLVTRNETGVEVLFPTSAQADASNASAANSATSAQTSLTNFQNQYMGPLAAAPATRPSGAALQIGDLYFDTATGMRVYSATGWVSAGSSVNGTAKRGSITATAGQTVFNVPGGFDSGFIDVFLDGAKLKNVEDVTVNASPNVTLAIGALAGQTLDYVAYGTFVVADTYNQATIDAKANALSGRNRLINGAMTVSQRRGVGVEATGAGNFGTDRWTVSYGSTTGAPTVSLAGAGPLAFATSFQGYQNTAATTTLTEFMARQQIELVNVRDLAGKKVNVSFWYRSNKAGQHAARVIGTLNAGVTGGQDFILPFTYNVAAAWEYKTLTFDSLLNITNWGSTADTAAGVIVDIGFKSGGIGFTSLAVGDYFQVTGVQFEAGSVATPFEFRPYSVELELCQRYFEVFHGVATPVANVFKDFFFKIPKRVVPTVALTLLSTGTGVTFTVNDVNRCYQETVNSAPSNFTATASAEL